jgi:hypothetical protein
LSLLRNEEQGDFICIVLHNLSRAETIPVSATGNLPILWMRGKKKRAIFDAINSTLSISFLLSWAGENFDAPRTRQRPNIPAYGDFVYHTGGAQSSMN